MQASNWLKEKNERAMQFIPLEGYGQVYTEATVVALLQNYARHIQDEIAEAGNNVPMGEMFSNGSLIGASVHNAHRFAARLVGKVAAQQPVGNEPSSLA